jgi:hypothetical protein
MKTSQIILAIAMTFIASVTVALACTNIGASNVNYTKQCRSDCIDNQWNGESNCTYETADEAIFCDCINGKQNCRNNKNAAGYDDAKTMNVTSYSNSYCSNTDTQPICQHDGQSTTALLSRIVQQDTDCNP